MAIYTSYYGKMRSIPKYVVTVAISRGIPDWYDGFSYSPLSPEWKIVDSIKKGTITWEQYEQSYRAETLAPLNPQTVARQLQAFGKDVVLLCYEKTPPCHRFIVRDWFNENGIACKEWDGMPLEK